MAAVDGAISRGTSCSTVEAGVSKYSISVRKIPPVVDRRFVLEEYNHHLGRCVGTVGTVASTVEPWEVPIPPWCLHSLTSQEPRTTHRLLDILAKRLSFPLELI